jgi:hypothetical protein
MASNSPLVPYSIQVPGGAPQNFLGVAMFLTQFCSIVNGWIKQSANAINSLLTTTVQTVVGIPPISAVLTGTQVVISLVTPLTKAFGGTGAATGITLTGDITGVGAPTIATTLPTVNTNVGSYTNANITVNGKGQVTAAASGIGTGLSGMTAGQLPIAATATTITSSIAYGTSGNSTILETGSGGQIAAAVMPAFTGDATSVAGAVALTLATVNVDTGTINGVTTNGKGLVTANVNQNYLTANQSITLSGDVSGSGTTAIAVTLDTVNTNTSSANGVTANGKGLVTANVSQGYWVANADWSFSGNSLIGSVSGQTAPTILVNDAYLHLVGTTSGSPGVQVNTYAGFVGFVGARADGTPASPTTIGAAENMMLFRSYGYNGTSYVEGSRLSFSSSAAWTGSANGAFIDFYTTATASTTITPNMRLNNDGGLALPSTAASEGSGTINVANGYYIAASNIQTAKAATSKTTASPGSVTATSATYKMLGFAGTITPKWNTAIMLTITGSVTDATLADTVTLVASYGTSTAPTNGANLTGTQVGSVYAFAQAVASDATGFAIGVVITGLTAGTAYWLDLAVGSAGGHAITFGSTNISAHEI